MGEDFESYDRIDKYLAHEMTEEEKADFEADLVIDESLRQELEVERTLRFTLVGNDVFTFQTEVSNVVNQIEKPTDGVRRWWVFGALGLFVLMGIVAVLWVTKKEGSTDFAQNHSDELMKDVLSLSDSLQEAKPITPLPIVTKNESQEIIKLDKTDEEDIFNLNEANRESGDVNQLEKDTLTDSRKTVAKEEEEVISYNVVNDEVAEDSDPCLGIIMTGEVFKNDPAADANNGKITVDLKSIEGGSGGYQFRIDQKEEFGMNVVFDDLQPGQFQVEVKDAQGCQGKLKQVNLQRKVCLTNYEAAFSPDFGGDWKVPLSESLSGEIRIVSKAGLTIIEKQFNDGEYLTWDGKTPNGDLATPGLYMILINYEGGIECTAKVTIRR